MVCFDKTGTLTEGRLRAARFAGPDGDLEPSDPARRYLLTTAARACPPAAADAVSTVPHATDRAILEAALAQRADDDGDHVGYIDESTRAIFGRTYAAEPDVLVEQLAADEAIAAADTLLLTVPNQLGVEYNAHVIESVLKYVAPELGWR